MGVTALVALLSDASQLAYSLRALINLSILEDNQLPIFQAITLPRLIELLKIYENDEDILPLFVWLLSHLALNDEAGCAMLQSEELVSFICALLERDNKLLVGKTLWLLNNLSLLEECQALSGIIRILVSVMVQSIECNDLETFITCCDIVLNLIHKDTCVEYLQVQNTFVGCNGLQLMQKAIHTYSENAPLLNVVSAIIELVSAYLGELRVKIVEIELIEALVSIIRNNVPDTEAAQEQALRVIFNLSFLAGTKEFDAQVIRYECVTILIELLLLDPPEDNLQKISVNILANLLISDAIRQTTQKSSLASGLALVARGIRGEQTVRLSTLVSAVANAAIDDECREELRKNGIENELQRFSQNCHPSLRSVISAAQDNLKLNGAKTTPMFMDLHGNNSGFVGRLLDKRSSLTPSSKREIKPRTQEKPKESIAEMLYAAVPTRQYSRFLSGGIGNDEWKD